MDFTDFQLTKDDAGRRIDRVIRNFLPDVPLSGIYRYLRKGLIKCNGRRVSPSFTTPEGGYISIASAIIEISDDTPQADRDVGLTILFENTDILFVNKPAGIPTHGDKGLTVKVGQSADALNSLSFSSGPLHRLDKDTSGVIAFSKTLDGAKWFSSIMAERRLQKTYIGIASGEMTGNADWVNIDIDGKEMHTGVSSLYSIPDYSLLVFHLHTGRKHQIRKQCSLHGLPLLGDLRYGGKPVAGGHAGYFLHAYSLSFNEPPPWGGPSLITAPLPDAFLRQVKLLFGDNVLALLQNGDLYCTQ